MTQVSDLEEDTPRRKGASLFNDVTSRTFPLAADIATLQAFVDAYLNREENLVRDHNFYFRVSSPFVQMQLISYGEMSAPGYAGNFITQREWLFQISLEWYERDDEGAYEFNSERYRPYKYPLATVTPYVFVDNALSLLGGRQQFGWPKTIMKITPAQSPWMKQPTSDIRLLTVEAMFLKDVHSTDRPTSKPILHVDRRPGYSSGISKQHFSDSMMRYVYDMKDSFAAQGEISRYMMNQYRQFLGSKGKRPNAFTQINQQIKANLDQLKEPVTNTIGLKQFRDSDDVNKSCYLAIANSRVKVASIEGIGLLGSVEAMMTSLSGGYSIRLYNYSQLPIVEKLGLKVAESVPGSDGEPPVSILKPIMPYWANMNLEYFPTEPDEIIMEAVHGRRARPRMDKLPDLMSEYFIKELEVSP